MMESKLKDSNSSAYSYPYMVIKLNEHFGDYIVFANLPGMINIITEVLQEFYQESNRLKNPEDEKLRIIKTAAELIKFDLKSIQKSEDTYPDLNDLNLDCCLNFLPVSLQTFLKKIITIKSPDLKIACIGQALMKESRPRTIQAPLQIFLGIQLLTQFASKNLITSLNHMGFCTSYEEVQCCEKNAAIHQGISLPYHDGTFIQFSADKCYHNICTIDGKDSFHGTAMVASITPEAKIQEIIPRITELPQQIL